MTKTFFLLLFLLPLTSCIFQSPQPTVQINQQVWQVELAQKPSEHARGLMHRTDLKNDEGMLFIFADNSIHNFWMKNTLIPLDVIWINRDLQVVEIATLQPCHQATCPIYRSQHPADYVLEVNAGNFEGKVGDTAVINLIP